MFVGLITIWPLMRHTWPPLFDSKVAWTGSKAFCVVLVAAQHERDLFPHKFIKQLRRVEQVVLIVLFQDSQRRRSSQGSEMEQSPAESAR